MLHSAAPFSPITGSGTGTTIPFPRSVAVDETTGNLFVSSGEGKNVAVKIFDSEGGPPAGLVSPFQLTGFEENELVQLALDNSPTSPNKGTLYVTDSGHLTVKKYVRNAGTEKYEAAGELTPVPPFTPFGGESGPPAGVTVDEAGNVYVSIRAEVNGFGSIIKFSPSGTQLARVPASKATSGPIGLAVNGDGDLFVARQAQDVIVYPANGLGEIEAGTFAEIPLLDNVRGIAIDRAADILYASHNVGNTTHVAEFDASSLQEKGDFGYGATEAGGQGLAVNEADGLLYVADSPILSTQTVRALNLNGPTIPDVSADPPSPLKVISATLQGTVDPEGLEVTECKFEYGAWTGPLNQSAPCAEALPIDSDRHPVSAQISGLAPNELYEYRLVVKNANGTQTSAIKRLRTKSPAETTAASDLGTEGATLNAIVHPEGSAISECKFEYALEETFQETKAYEAALPCDPDAGSIPADFEPHEVSAELSGLLVGTTYRFRILATGGFGTTEGEDLTFLTAGPSVLSKRVAVLGETTVTLEAQINPRGKATTYHFEYGTEGPCGSNPCTSVPVPDEAVGAGTSAVAVSQQIKGLGIATTYYYRVIVTNSDGSGHSKDGTFTTHDVPPSFGACPNDAFRKDKSSARLPDCRAYERATPLDKNGNDAGGQLYKVQASLSGDGVTTQIKSGMAGSEGSQVYPLFLLGRDAAGWSAQGLLPPQSLADSAQLLGWTPDFAYSFATLRPADSNLVGTIDSALTIRSVAARTVTQITPFLDGARYAFAGASADNSKLFFEAEGPNVALVAGAVKGKPNLYLYEPGSEEMSLVGLLPASQGGKAPPGGSFAGPYDWWQRGASKGGLVGGGALGNGGATPGENGYDTKAMHAISADGSKAFFTAGASGQIYVREGLGGEEPETFHVSGSQRTTPDPNGAKPAIFTGATPDGSKAFFLSCQKLTDDSTAHSSAANDCDTPAQGMDLYAYDTATHQLTDLTVHSATPDGAEVMGMLGASDDGSYVYFAANGDLDEDGPAQAGDCQRPFNAGSTSDPGYTGSCSLYVWHEGSSTFIARLDLEGAYSLSDVANWLPGGNRESPPTARVSADGQTLVFRSRRQLTAYDTRPSGGECVLGTCPQLYRYQVGDSEPTCVTCNPTGVPPSGLGEPRLQSIEGGVTIAAPPIDARFVSADGNRVFFETPEKLVGADVNGDDGCPKVRRPIAFFPSCQDVYEWEAPGSGSCTEASSAYSAQNQGCLYLLSTGTSPDPSYFGDASLSGDVVFIFTGEQLVPADVDHLYDVYAVSVGGGLASQNQPPPLPPCEAGGCREGSSAPPSTPSAGSASFQGPGDPPLKRCAKGKVRKGNRCVKPHKKSRKHHKRQAKQRAGADKG